MGLLFLIPLLLLLKVAISTSECPQECLCSEAVTTCNGKGLTSIPTNLPVGTKKLLLANNQLVSIRKSDFNSLLSLEHLELQNNSIRHLEEFFLDSMPQLKYLDISRNRLRFVPKLSMSPNKIEHLNLGFNMISKVDVDLTNNSPNLHTLLLSKNRIQSFPHVQFMTDYTNNRLVVHMAGNPWSCDCRLVHMKMLQDKITGFGQNVFVLGKCFFPLKLRGQMFSDVSISELNCATPTSVVENGERILTCPITAEESFHLTNVWLKGNDEITLFNNSVRVNSAGSLIVPLENGDDIRCTVDRLRYSKDQTSKTSSESSASNQNTEVEIAPQFTFVHEERSSRDGDALELSCEVSGNPKPMVSWVFQEMKIMESRKHKISNDGQVLKIYPFLESDVGKYACIAKNTRGSVTHYIDVTMKASEKPMIFDPPADTKAEIGQMTHVDEKQVTLRCNARGVPHPDIVWLFEGTRIPRRNTRFTISENNVELTIEKVTRHDSGKFVCQASNSIGLATAEASLMVDTDFTSKVDNLLNDMTINDIAKQAKEKVENALTSTKDQRKIDKIENPNDLRRLFKFALPLKKVDLGKAREIYEESIRLVQMHINNGLKFSSSMISPNVSYEAVLPVSYVQTLMEKSGCQTGQFVESCEDHCFFSKYRSYDGQCNNYEHPMWGVSEMSFLRLLPPRYENGFNTPVGWEKGRLYNGYELPNARKVSRVMIGTDEITPHTHLSAMTMQWGQFVDHDLTLTAPALTRHSYREGAFCNRTCENVDPCFNIQLEADDPKLHTGLYQKYPCMEFERNGAACGSGETSPIFQRVTYRDQLNVLTAYLDASGIYGNSEEQALELRDLYSDHGLLRFDIVSSANKPYMPFEKDSDMDCRRNYSNENPINCFLAGDIRANEQLGLMSMHTIFMREHNRIASQLLEINENWEGETIFQETRKIVGAVLQHITYTEWLPKILGKTTFDEIIGEYKGYNPDVNPTIANEFATAALRFAHTLINPHLFRFDKDFKEIKEGHLPLHNAFFAPERLVSEGGVDPLLRGLFAAPIKMPKPNQILNKELTEKLFNRYHEVALDLAALNIQRGRDHGLPTWTEYRKFCNLSVPNGWEGMKNIVHDDSVIEKLRGLYGVPENIDLWVGGVTEKRTSDALMGPTLACIIADQFRRTRDGDRFWYENEEVFSKAQIRQLKRVTLAKILCNNGDSIDRIQRDVFIYHGNTTAFYEKCDEMPNINLRMWATCCDSSCSVGSSLATNSIGEKKVKRKKRTNIKNKKVCEWETSTYNHGESFSPSNDKCVKCTCEDGRVFCAVEKGCEGRS